MNKVEKNMKNKFKGFALSVVLFSSQVIAEDGYTNYVHMVGQGVESTDTFFWQLEDAADSQENFLVNEAVPEGGATFILSTFRDEPFGAWTLANASVNAYLPSAEIRVTTHDTVSETDSDKKFHTRADQKIRVQVVVSGLVDSEPLDDEDNSAQREISLQNFAESYPEGENSLPNSEIQSEAYETSALVGNGTFSGNALDFFTSLNPAPADPFDAWGEEHIIVRSLADSNLPGTVLDKVRIKVWPVWKGSQIGLSDDAFNTHQAPTSGGIVGDFEQGDDLAFKTEEGEAEAVLNLQEGEVFYESSELPDVTFQCRDLYPGSSVRVLATEASESHPWGGIFVPGTQKTVNGDHPDALTYNETIPASTLQNLFQAQGRYTLWLVVDTPGIGWEVGGRLDSNGDLEPGGWNLTVVNPTITVRGSIHSLQ